MASYGGYNRNPPVRQRNERAFQHPPRQDYDYSHQSSGYQQQWDQGGHDTYDGYGVNEYAEYQEGPYSDHRQPYQAPPPNTRDYGQPRDPQSRRSYDHVRATPNTQQTYSGSRLDPRQNYQDYGHRTTPMDVNANRPQSSRQYNDRTPMQRQYPQVDSQPRQQQYERDYGPLNVHAWQDPHQQSQHSRETQSSNAPPRQGQTENEVYGTHSGYRDNRPDPKRRTPPQAATERVRKPLIEPSSPSELNYDNPFPVFPTKKNGLKPDNGAAVDAHSGRMSQEPRGSDIGKRMLQNPDPTRDPPGRSNGNRDRSREDRHASLDAGRFPQTEALALRPIETEFGHSGRFNAQQQSQEPVSAADFHAPRAPFSVPQRPGSAPGVQSPPLDSGAAPSFDEKVSRRPIMSDQRPPVGRQFSDSAFNSQIDSNSKVGERMPNFDKAEQRLDDAKNIPLYADSPSTKPSGRPTDIPQQHSQYEQNSLNNSDEVGYASMSGNPFQSENGTSWEQSPPRHSSSQAYNDGYMLQRAATAYEEPLARPPPRRQMTADSHFSDPGAGFGGQGPRGPGGLPRPQYNDPRGPHRGPPTSGPPQRFEQGQRGYDVPANRGYDGTGPSYDDREGGYGPTFTGVPPAGTRLDSNRGGPPNASGFRPRPPGNMAVDSYGQPPERQQSFPRDPNAPRAPLSDIQPRPPPVRPGLNGNTSSMGGSRPPPVRRYDANPSAPGPPPQRQLSNPGSSSTERPPPPPPVTQADLNRLREAIRANPSNSKAQMELARKLVEASVVLADEGGRADARTISKNRLNYTSEAHKVLKRLVSSGYPEAMFFLADSLSSGSLGLENDPKEAFSLYQQAAKAGHAASAYRTAVCCEIGPEDGGGTRKDPIKAMQWYKRAAALGDVPAMFKLGMIQLKGLLGQERNVVEGCTWLKRAADKADEENPHALHELALLYENGEGPSNMPRDPAMALQLFSQAAKLGLKSSQFRLGQAYEYGLLGCPVDARNSIVWYTRAAAQGEHQSELALSGWYLTGSEGILEHSDTEAYLWARKAAQAHPPLPKAMFAMGYFTEVGIGCPRSLEEAKRWYGRAASHRFPKAQERLEELKKGGIKANGGRQQLSRTNKQQTDADCVLM